MKKIHNSVKKHEAQGNESQLANNQRRVFLKSLSTALGCTAAATLLGGTGMSVALAYKPNPNSTMRPGLLFTQAQMKTLHDICATILPATDTKSGAQVDCHGFVDHQLVQCHSQEQQQTCVNAITLIQENAKKQYKKEFTELDLKQQTQVLVDIESLSSASENQKSGFTFLKSLIVFGFFTSEEGVTKATTFQPFPGGFKGSIPLNANTKAWGSLNYY